MVCCPRAVDLDRCSFCSSSKTESPEQETGKDMEIFTTASEYSQKGMTADNKTSSSASLDSSLDSSSSVTSELSQTTNTEEDVDEMSETSVDTVEASKDAPVTNMMASLKDSPELTRDYNKQYVEYDDIEIEFRMTDCDKIYAMSDDDSEEVYSPMGMTEYELFLLASLDSLDETQSQYDEYSAREAQMMAQEQASLLNSLSYDRQQQLMNRGLMNFGNSCYMNSSLQCLFNAESFCSQLVSQIGDFIYHPDAELIRCFINLYSMRECEDPETKALLLMQLMEAAGQTNPDFTVYTQNDAHEFLFHILNQMEYTVEMLGFIGGVAYICPIRANFRFQLKSIITCTGCGNEKTRLEDFNYLSLAVASQGSVSDCLSLFFSEETELACTCELCNCSSATCRWMFHTLPRILVLQLKRFHYSTTSIEKQHSAVQIDPSLQLALPVFPDDQDSKQTLTPKNTPTDEIRESEDKNEPEKKSEKKSEKNELDKSVCSYSLVSVLNHIGPSIHCGHYMSDCSSQSDSCWLSYNDDSVFAMKEERVLEKRRSSAYVLFYECQ